MANETLAGAGQGASAGAAVGSIVPGIGTAIGGAVGGIIGGIAGFFGSKGDKDKANKLLQEAYAEIQKVGAPPDLSRQIILEKFKSAGMYTPQLEQEVDLAVSKVAKIQEDPALRDTQMGALNLIKQRAMGGLNPEDRAAFAKALNTVNTQTRGANQSLIQEMASRGQSGAGSELAARLSANQHGAQDAAEAGLNIAGQASANALSAAAQSGNLAGNIRSQDFNVANTKASAEDERNRLLFNNSQALRARNTASNNQAQINNLNNAQQISNLNTAQGNDELRRQVEAERQAWLDKLALAQTKSNVASGQANAYTNKANSTAGRFTSGGSALGTLLGKTYDAYGKSGDDDLAPTTDLGKKYRAL